MSDNIEIIEEDALEIVPTRHKNVNPDGTKMAWPQLLEALQYTHSVSVRDICQMLKCSRSWAMRYVRPHLTDAVYISNGREGDRYHGVPWNKIAAIMINRPLKEEVYFNQDQVKSVITSWIGAATRKTRNIPVETLMTPKMIVRYHEKCDDEIRKIERLKNSDRTDERLQGAWQEYKMQEMWSKYVSEEVYTLLEENIPKVTKRGEAIEIAVPLTAEEIYKLRELWDAPHDRKNYGDTDEKIYRYYFKYGYIRFELNAPDSKTGEVGKKVYYLRAPEDRRIDLAYKDTRQHLTIKETTWQALQPLLTLRELPELSDDDEAEED